MSINDSIEEAEWANTSDTKRGELRREIDFRLQMAADTMTQEDLTRQTISILDFVDAECLALLERLEKQAEYHTGWLYEGDGEHCIPLSVIEQAKKEYETR